MNVGISVPLPAYLVDVGAMARTAEALGFESFWCAEHPFIPVHTTSRFPGTADGVIPEAYSHFIDPFVALARASGTTSRIKLATGIVLVPERHPLLLAKEVSTLDLFSGGRPVRSNPKPAQKPHPPVLLGGDAPRVLERVVAWGDGWLPNRVTPVELREKRAALDRLAKEAGRDPAAISISVHGQPADRDLITRFHDAGATRVIVRPATSKSEPEMVRELTRIAEAVLR